MNGKDERTRKRGHSVDRALAQIDRSVIALESCREDLTPEGYRLLRIKLGHLMDTLYTIGKELSKST